jgi:hypothetical protein
VALPTQLVAKRSCDAGAGSCSVTVMEVKGIDTRDARALGRTTRRDAEHDCSKTVDVPRCIDRLTAQPPVVIVANCEKGTTSFYGAREFNLSARGKAGELEHAEDPNFWETQMTHRERYAAITWLRLLCPRNSFRWHVRHEPQ